MDTLTRICFSLQLLVLQAVVFHFDCITTTVPTEVQLLIQSSPMPNQDGDYKVATIQLQELLGVQVQSRINGPLLYKMLHARPRRSQMSNLIIRTLHRTQMPQSQLTMTINYTLAEDNGQSQVHVSFGPVLTDIRYHIVCLSPNSTQGTRCTQRVNITEPDPEMAVYKMTFNHVPPDCYNIMILPAESPTWYPTGPFCVKAIPPTPLKPRSLVLIALVCVSAVAAAISVVCCLVLKRMNHGQAVLPKVLRFWKTNQAASHCGQNNQTPDDHPAANFLDNRRGSVDDDHHRHIPNGGVMPLADRIENVYQWANVQMEPDYMSPDSTTYQHDWNTAGPAYEPVRQHQSDIICTHPSDHNMGVIYNGRNGYKCQAVEPNGNIHQTKPNALSQNGSCAQCSDLVYQQAAAGSRLLFDSGFSEPIADVKHVDCNDKAVTNPHVVKETSKSRPEEFCPPDSDSESDSQSMLNQKLAGITQRYMTHTDCLANNDTRLTACRRAVRDK